LVIGGFGAHANSRGSAVYCTHLNNGEHTRFERYQVLGVVKELPDWAKDSLARLQAEKDKPAERLAPYTGAQVTIPLCFVEYELKSQQDVEDYLALLAGVPAELEELLTYEQARSEIGIFMTREAYAMVITTLDAIVRTQKNNAVLSTFAEAIEGMKDLSDEQKMDYLTRQRELVEGSYHQAFVNLRDGLNKIRGTSRRTQGFCEMDDKTAKNYFALRVHMESDKDLDIASATALLQQALKTIADNPNAWAQLAERVEAKDAALLPQGIIPLNDAHEVILATLVSIHVNYYGYTAGDLANAFGISPQRARELYTFSITCPFTYMPYRS